MNFLPKELRFEVGGKSRNESQMTQAGQRRAVYLLCFFPFPQSLEQTKPPEFCVETAPLHPKQNVLNVY